MSLYVKLEGVSKVFPNGASATDELRNALSPQSSLSEISVGKRAVNEVSLSLGEGERLGIVGRNGAGKSTLLHLIAGISNPSSGHVHIKGQVTSILTLGIGLREELNGRENIYIDGEIQGKSRAEVDEVIQQVIEFSELGAFIEYPVRTYSTGMKARLAFSMITHLDPEILIIDEALSVGDASFASKATAKILEICNKGKIVILVSHGMQSIRDICNRCIYMKDGVIIMDGAPEAVTKAYIDDVHAEEENALIARFSAHTGTCVYRPGYSLLMPTLLTGVESVKAVRIEAGSRLRILIEGSVPAFVTTTVCKIKIVRLDDVVFFEQEFQAVDYCNDSGLLALEIEFESLLLAPAKYQLHVQIIEKVESSFVTCVTASSIFEVYAYSAPAGGKPMLYHPILSSVVQK